MIITEAEKAKSIASAIRNALNIDEPGRGIVFTAAVSQALGLY